MRLSAGALALLLAAVARAADQAAPPVEIHPLLIGSLAEPNHPLIAPLALHAEALAAAGPASLSPAMAEERLAPLRNGEPSERLAAAVLSRALVEPEAAARLAAVSPKLASVERLPAARSAPEARAWEPLRRAAAETRKNPAAVAIFDGGAKGSTLDGLAIESGWFSESLVHGGRPASFIGRGDFGVVHEHPAVSGAVVKVIAPIFEAVLAGVKPKEQAKVDEEAARRGQAAGLSERLLGVGTISGRPALVKERVYGDTLDKAIRERRFGPEDRALVMDLLGRMADAGLQGVDADLHAHNIMLGRTALQPERRAYLIDGALEEAPPAASREAAVEALLDKPFIVRWRFDPNTGKINTSYDRLGRYMAEGLERAKQTSRWDRFKTWLSDTLAASAFPTH